MMRRAVLLAVVIVPALVIAFVAGRVASDDPAYRSSDLPHPDNDALPRIRDTYEYETLMGIGGYVRREGPCFYFYSGSSSKDRVLMVFYRSVAAHTYDFGEDHLVFSGRPVPYETIIMSNYTSLDPAAVADASTFLVPPDSSCDTTRVAVMSKSFSVMSPEWFAMTVGTVTEFIESTERLLAGHDRRLLEMIASNPTTGGPDIRIDGIPVPQSEAAAVLRRVVQGNSATIRMLAFAEQYEDGDPWASGFRLRDLVRLERGQTIAALVLWSPGEYGTGIRIDLLRDTAPIDHYLANSIEPLQVQFSIDQFDLP